MINNKEQNLLIVLIQEMIEEQNALAGGMISATGGLPLTKKPKIFDPENPKHKNKNKKKEN